MICDLTGACAANCEDHWGDCNQDYRDGCEAPTKHRLYCDGSPLIKLSERALILAYVKASKGPGRFDELAFDRSLHLHKAEWQACYEEALSRKASLAGIIVYELKMNEASACLEPKLVRDDLADHKLAACLRTVFDKATFNAAPAGGPVTFEYHLNLGPPDHQP